MILHTEYWLAQCEYNMRPRINIPPGLQPLKPDPYQNKIRKNGILVPESMETFDIEFDADYDYITH